MLDVILLIAKTLLHLGLMHTHRNHRRPKSSNGDIASTKLRYFTTPKISKPIVMLIFDFFHFHFICPHFLQQ